MAIRNIKLIFSRKLMYTSGLFSVAMTIDRSEMAKVDLLERLFDLPVIDRMIEICGESRMIRALESYDLFLSRLEDAKVRSELKAVEPENHGNASFRELKNEGIASPVSSCAYMKARFTRLIQFIEPCYFSASCV